MEDDDDDAHAAGDSLGGSQGGAEGQAVECRGNGALVAGCPQEAPGWPLAASLVIATPAYGHMVHSAYVTSLVASMGSLREAGHRVLWLTNALSSARGARADLASKFLGLTDATHIMWVDADVSWDAGTIEQLLAHDLPVVAGLYPKKQNQLEFAAKWMPVEGGRAPLRFHGGGDRLLEVEAVGAGFVLVKREVYLKMMQAHPELHLWKLREGTRLEPWIYDFYPDDRMGNGTIEGEDYGFCRLWRELGGAIWVDTSIVLGHHGSWTFTVGPHEPREVLRPHWERLAKAGLVVTG